MITSSSKITASSRGCSNSTRRLQRHSSWQCNVSVLKLMNISLALSYLLSCQAFHSVSSLLSTQRISTMAPSRVSTMIPQSSGVGRQFRSTAAAVQVQGQTNYVGLEHGEIAKCCSHGRLFPHPITPTRSRRRMHQITMMVSNDNSSPVANNDRRNNVWRSIRTILARLWVSTFLFPSQLCSFAYANFALRFPLFLRNAVVPSSEAI